MISHQTDSKNLEQYLVGLTGNICSGKSKTAEYFKELGAHVIDLDGIVHELYKKNISLRYELYKNFGLKIFNRKLEVDREKLGGIIFNDESKKKKLESIVWPYADKEAQKKIKDKKGIIIIEAAMLYESGRYKNFDKNVLVITDEEKQIKRLMERNYLSKEEALKRIRAQIPQLEKVCEPNYIIKNNGTLELLKRNVGCIWERLNNDFFYKKVTYLL